MAAKRKDTEPTIARPDFDIFASHLPPLFTGAPQERNIWRVDSTLIIYKDRKWQRVPLHSDDAKAWARFLMASWSRYNEWSLRLRQYVQAQLEARKVVTLGQPAQVRRAA